MEAESGLWNDVKELTATVRLEVFEDKIGELAILLGKGSLDIIAVRLAELRVLVDLDEDDSPGEDEGGVVRISVLPDEILSRDPDLEATMEDVELTASVEELGIESKTEEWSVTLVDAIDVSGLDAIVLRTVVAIDTNPVRVVVRPDCRRVVVGARSLPLLPIAGSGSETVNSPLDIVFVGLAAVGELAPEATEDDEDTWVNVTPLVNAVVIATDDVSTSPGRGVEIVISDIEEATIVECVVMIEFGELVETNVIVKVCPSDCKLVTVVGKAELNEADTAGALVDVAAPGGSAGSGARLELPTVGVIVDATELLEVGGKTSIDEETDRLAEIEVTNMLVKTVADPPGMKLVITPTKLEIVTNPPTLVSSGEDGTIAL